MVGYLHHISSEGRRKLTHIVFRSLSAQNYYQILGVTSSASKKDIKNAYLDKAKKCHPDLFPNDVEKTKEFQLLQEAYNTLSNQQDRISYDHHGTKPYRHSNQGRHPSGYPHEPPFKGRYNPHNTNDPFKEWMEQMHKSEHPGKFDRLRTDQRFRKEFWTRVTYFSFIFCFPILFVLFYGTSGILRSRDPEKPSYNRFVGQPNVPDSMSIKEVHEMLNKYKKHKSDVSIKEVNVIVDEIKSEK